MPKNFWKKSKRCQTSEISWKREKTLPNLRNFPKKGKNVAKLPKFPQIIEIFWGHLPVRPGLRWASPPDRGVSWRRWAVRRRRRGRSAGDDRAFCRPSVRATCLRFWAGARSRRTQSRSCPRRRCRPWAGCRSRPAGSLWAGICNRLLRPSKKKKWSRKFLLKLQVSVVYLLSVV